MKLYLKIEVISKRKNTVCVTTDSMKMAQGWNMLRFLTDADLDKIEQWVKNANIGRRISYDMWQLKNKTCVMTFLLAWDGKSI